MKLKNLLTNTSFFVGVSLVLLIVSICLDLYLDKTNFFQRAGSFVAGLGAIVLVRKLLSLTYEDAVKDEYIIDGGSFDTDFNQVEIEARKNVNAIRIGTFLIFVGSIISGYGDLLINQIK